MPTSGSKDIGDGLNFDVWCRLQMETGHTYITKTVNSGIIRDEQGQVVDLELAANMLCAKAFTLYKLEAKGRA